MSRCGIEIACANGDSRVSAGESGIFSGDCCVDITVDEIQSRLTDMISDSDLTLYECRFTVCDELITGTFGQTSDGEVILDVDLGTG